MSKLANFIWSTDEHGQTVESKVWREYTGQSEQETKGLGWTAALHPDDREAVRTVWLRAVAERVPYETEFRLRGTDGEYRSFLSRGVPVARADGSICQWVGFCSDITERKEAEAAGRRAARAGEALRHSLLAINACVDMNAALACLLRESLQVGGLDGGAIYLLAGREAVLQHHLQWPAEMVREASRSPLTLNYIDEVLKNPGEVLYVTDRFPEHHRATQIHGLRHVYSLALVSEQGPFGFMNLVSLCPNPPGDSAIEMIRILVLETESTFKRLAAGHRLQLVLTTMAEGVVVHGPDGRITECNASAERILGLSRDEIMERKPVDPRWRAVHADGRDFPPAEHPLQVTLRTGQPVRDVRMGIRRPDGGLKWININTQPMLVPGESGPPSVVVSFSDITQWLRLEAGLRQSQKLESIGRLAGGVAHEFNNILAALMLGLELTRDLTRQAEVRDHLAGMMGLSDRAAGLVRQLLAFSRQSVAKYEQFDLAAETTRQLKMLSPLLGAEILVEFHCTTARTRVNADKHLLAQVIMNLCLNARDAMNKGGRLVLQLADAEAPEDLSGGAQPDQRGPQVCLSFTDTGCGMAAEVQARLFEPFFTTKEVGQGTGLGLATAQGIVVQHGGRITVESTEGKGSIFRVWLPSLPSAEAPDRTARVEGRDARAATILVVDDEACIRTMMRLLLTRSGFLVLEAADGRQALERWHQHRSEIKLVYTDLNMPGDLNGWQLMELVLAESPVIKGIIASGFIPDPELREKIAAAKLVCLPKPCPPPTILEVIRNCLGTNDSGNQ